MNTSQQQHPKGFSQVSSKRKREAIQAEELQDLKKHHGDTEQHETESVSIVSNSTTTSIVPQPTNDTTTTYSVPTRVDEMETINSMNNLWEGKAREWEYVRTHPTFAKANEIELYRKCLKEVLDLNMAYNSIIISLNMKFTQQNDIISSLESKLSKQTKTNITLTKELSETKRRLTTSSSYEINGQAFVPYFDWNRFNSNNKFTNIRLRKRLVEYLENGATVADIIYKCHRRFYKFEIEAELSLMNDDGLLGPPKLLPDGSWMFITK